MNVVVYEHYGKPDVLKIKNREKPIPADGEVVIKVHATTVSPVDWHCRSGKPFLARIMAGGFIKPKITVLGFDISGEIASIGQNVQSYKIGDHVYGLVPFGSNGASAEYICVSENDVIMKPSSISSVEAAAIPTTASIALAFLRAGGIKSGHQVLINGASGGLGTIAIQLAKQFGAEVTAVCSTSNLKLVRSLGADNAIDYSETDFAQNGSTYDLIFDAVGKSTFPDCKSSLNKDGVYISTILTFQILFYMLWTGIAGSRKAKFVIPKVTMEDVKYISNLIEAGTVNPVVDRCFTLEQIAEAHRYSEAGHAKGKIVVTVANDF